MNYWKPKSDTANAGISGGVLSSMPQQPKIELPVVGDKLLINVGYRGYMQIVDPDHLTGGQELVEVEVTAVKRVTTSIE